MATPLRVLIVEDSLDDTALLVRELQRGGFDPTYRRVETAAEMLEALRLEPWDVIISDYFMPQFDAMQALATLRSTGLDLPFILVSGSVGEEMAVESMRAGMHDYIFKDNLSRLCPAVTRELHEAQIRRDRQQAREALHQAYAELERRVEERTQELRLANARLAREIEERTKAEKQARLDKTRLELAVRASDGIYWNAAFDPTTPGGENLSGFVTDGMRQLIGMGPEEPPVTLAEWLAWIHPDDKSKRSEVIRAHLDGVTDRYETEYRIRHRDGHYLWLQVEGVALRDAAGQPEHWVRFLWDITERKLAEQVMQQANDELERRVTERTAELLEVNRVLDEERQALERKNIAIQEILDQIRANRDELKQQLMENLETAVLPDLRLLKAGARGETRLLIESLEKGLHDALSPFVSTLKRHAANLSPREVEICRHIRNGLATKEIADLLNLSPMTVQKHRETIRRKLGLANEETNLQTYLQQIVLHAE